MDYSEIPDPINSIVRPPTRREVVEPEAEPTEADATIQSQTNDHMDTSTAAEEVSTHTPAPDDVEERSQSHPPAQVAAPPISYSTGEINLSKPSTSSSQKPVFLTKFEGFHVPQVDASIYILIHELHQGVVLLKERGLIHRKTFTRQDYKCGSFKRCPFKLTIRRYTDRSNRAYFNVRGHHDHSHGERQRKNRRVPTHLSRMIDTMQRNGYSQEALQSSVEKLRDAVQKLDDPISEELERIFKQGSQASSAVDLMPCLHALRERKLKEQRQTRVDKLDRKKEKEKDKKK
eukprot:gnl/Dysnectes_brevis/7669_a13082_322.p1 GENE.gnl/Dysnectes_brevis/7669_a13082_322~~gnl/Dysnectes_brevis/7669_a13082_322.p1  ORF type:complete len:289 (+),score=22.83 gnl/Dysnectes_brevis/7669_a13082_322:2-868(+)